jgi:hypothetical protein
METAMQHEAGVYRDPSAGVAAELGALLDRRIREIELLPDAYRRTYARRAGRAAAGLVGAAGGVVLFAAAAGWACATRQVLGTVEPEGALTHILFASWVAALAAYALARAWAAMRFDAHLARQLALSGSPWGDLERLRNVSARAEAARLVRRAETPSAGLPLVALALLAPLSLHYVGAAVLGHEWPDAQAFDGWIVLSAVIVGHCHLLLAIQSWRFARRLRDVSDDHVADRAHRDAWAAFGWTVAASAVPGLILFGVPVFLVAVTGFFIPLAFALVASRVRRERLSLA